MIQQITDKEHYSFNPVLETNEDSYSTPITLFGKVWRIMDDYWMKHVHIKITDLCDASCPFCIERSSHIRSNNLKLFSNVQSLIEQLYRQGHLTTVSITGGEPSLSPIAGDVIDFLKSIPNVFLNINTNFHRLIDSSSDPDWLNISRHTIGADAYCHIWDLDSDKLGLYRAIHPTTKIRLQCVLYPKGLRNVEQIQRYIRFYSYLVDDFSFRRLISVKDETTDNDLFQQFKHFLYDNAILVEQVLKDYYVYETWNYEGKNITLSHSNMKLLHDLEHTEDDRILREIIVHPDGLVSGSWYRNKKIIAE